MRARGLGLVVASAVLVLLPAAAAVSQEAPQVPRMLRLSDAISIALEGSTLIGIQNAQLEATRKARLNALFNLGPDLSVSALRSSATRRDYDVPITSVIAADTLVAQGGTRVVIPLQESQTGVQDIDEESSFRQYALTTSVRLFDGFANFARLSAANHDVSSDEWALAYRRKQVTTNVTAAYYNLLRAKLLLKVAQEAEAVAQEQLERTQALYELGSAARSDVLKAQVQLGNTRLDLVRARNAERQGRTDLEYHMNLTTPVPFEIDTTVVDLPTQAVNYEAERDYALEHREDLLALREDQTAASRRVWAARGGLWPTVDFQYSVTRSKSTSQFRFGAAENRNRSWAFQANWNLWDRYQIYAGIGQARATARVSEYNRRQAELDATREVRTLVNQLAEAQERLTVARENVARSNEDLRLAQEKFRVGAGTILDTITAESDLTATKAAEVEAVVDYLIARADLVRATGRSFSEL
jgi:outer membrane protein TolC